VIGVQECTSNMAAEITQGLGPNWTFWGSGTAKIMWDATKWVALDQFQAGLPYTVMGIIKSRLITLLKLQSIKTDGFGWFVDTHLAVNIPNEEAIRQQQIRRAITLIEQRPDHERVISLVTSTRCRPMPVCARSPAMLDTSTYARSCRRL
jgi:hypothetical protein